MHDRVLRKLKKMQGERSLRVFARELGISTVYLFDIYHGRREPSETIARAAGFEKQVKRVVTYKPLED